MKAALAALALVIATPAIGASPASAFFFGDDSHYSRGYAHYGYAPRYRYYGHRHHYRNYGAHRAERYRSGSNRWWHAMDRDNRGGRGNR